MASISPILLTDTAFDPMAFIDFEAGQAQQPYPYDPIAKAPTPRPAPLVGAPEKTKIPKSPTADGPAQATTGPALMDVWDEAEPPVHSQGDISTCDDVLALDLNQEDLDSLFPRGFVPPSDEPQVVRDLPRVAAEDVKPIKGETIPELHPEFVLESHLLFPDDSTPEFLSLLIDTLSGSAPKASAGVPPQTGQDRKGKRKAVDIPAEESRTKKPRNANNEHGPGSSVGISNPQVVPQAAQPNIPVHSAPYAHYLQRRVGYIGHQQRPVQAQAQPNLQGWPGPAGLARLPQQHPQAYPTNLGFYPSGLHAQTASFLQQACQPQQQQTQQQFTPTQQQFTPTQGGQAAFYGIPQQNHYPQYQNQAPSIPQSSSSTPANHYPRYQNSTPSAPPSLPGGPVQQVQVPRTFHAQPRQQSVQQGAPAYVGAGTPLFARQAPARSASSSAVQVQSTSAPSASQGHPQRTFGAVQGAGGGTWHAGALQQQQQTAGPSASGSGSGVSSGFGVSSGSGSQVNVASGFPAQTDSNGNDGSETGLAEPFDFEKFTAWIAEEGIFKF